MIRNQSRCSDMMAPMEMPSEIPLDLEGFVGDDRVFVASGRESGVRAREGLRLNGTDADNNLYLIRVPKHIITMSPSFILGLIAPSVQVLGGVTKFFEKYKFETSQDVIEQIRRSAVYVASLNNLETGIDK